MRALAPLLPLLVSLAWAIVHFARYRWRYRAAGDPPSPSAAARRRGGSALLPPSVRAWWSDEIAPLVGWLVRHGVRPNHVTYAGTALAVLAAVAFALGAFVAGGYALLLGGVCDILDGHVARASGQATPAGAFLDSSLDRLADMLVLVGLAVAFRESWVAFAALAALVGSVLTSYARARAEGLGLSCRSGLMQRPERVLVIGFATLLDPALSAGLDALFGTGPQVVLPLALTVTAVLVNGTAFARIRTVYRALRDRGARPDGAAPSALPPGPPNSRQSTTVRGISEGRRTSTS